MGLPKVPDDIAFIRYKPECELKNLTELARDFRSFDGDKDRAKSLLGINPQYFPIRNPKPLSLKDRGQFIYADSTWEFRLYSEIILYKCFLETSLIRHTSNYISGKGELIKAELSDFLRGRSFSEVFAYIPKSSEANSFREKYTVDDLNSFAFNHSIAFKNRPLAFVTLPEYNLLMDSLPVVSKLNYAFKCILEDVD